jgi:hypothetical protein
LLAGIPKPSHVPDVLCSDYVRKERGSKNGNRNSFVGLVVKCMTHVNSAYRDLFGGIFICGKYRDLEAEVFPFSFSVMH